MLDFTQTMYRRLCREINEAGYQSAIMGDYFKPVEPDETRLFLRHDVDRDPILSLEMAQIEHEHKLVATYFFRVVDTVFKPDLITKIAGLGMEIGYHYECLDKAKGDYSKAYDTCQDDLKKLRAIAPVKSMAMHGNPLTKWDNRDLWKKYDYKQLGIEVAAYLNIDYTQTRYFSDTGRSWRESGGNIYDFVDQEQRHSLKTTPDLIDFLATNIRETIILTHPNRWSNQPSKWLYNWAYDTAGNMAKAMIKMIRK